MRFNSNDLKSLEQLAYLETSSAEESQLLNDINAIMDLVEQLKEKDTAGVSPLFHPVNSSLRLRKDIVTEASCKSALEAIAPQFEDNLYLVPKVIE